jgi:hypothetical protein
LLKIIGWAAVGAISASALARYFDLNAGHQTSAALLVGAVVAIFAAPSRAQ